MQERFQNAFSLKLNPKKYPWKNTNPHKNIKIPFSHALKNTHPRQLTFQKKNNKNSFQPACFVSILCDFMLHFHFWYFACVTLIQIWIHSAEACILAMSCLGYMLAWLKTFFGPFWKVPSSQPWMQSGRTTKEGTRSPTLFDNDVCSLMYPINIKGLTICKDKAKCIRSPHTWDNNFELRQGLASYTACSSYIISFRSMSVKTNLKD